MIVQPGKFQAIILDKNNSDLTNKELATDSQHIKTSSSDGVLGIHLDDKFNFNYHISNINRSIKLGSWSIFKTENKTTFLTSLHS